MKHFVVRAYQKIRPGIDALLLSSFGFKSECKMRPTCSEYMIISIQKYGTMRGVLRGLRRIFECH